MPVAVGRWTGRWCKVVEISPGAKRTVAFDFKNVMEHDANGVLTDSITSHQVTTVPAVTQENEQVVDGTKLAVRLSGTTATVPVAVWGYVELASGEEGWANPMLLSTPLKGQ